MKSHNSIRKFIFFVLSLIGFSSDMRGAVVLNFDSLITSPAGGVSNGFTIADSGFLLTADTSDKREFRGYEDGWQLNRGSSNGSTYAALWTASFLPLSFMIEPTLTPAFDLISIDLAEMLNNGDPSFDRVARRVSFEGHLLSGGSVTQNFILDLSSDGKGGGTDFETLALLPSFVGLSSVTIKASSGNSLGTYLAFDNISLQGAVPEPSVGALFGLALLLWGLVQRTR
ncbi:MAG: PEP-CTERM sorting domain-containing protein [Verrucomicrobia bacterium]|nr:PEP-CTERM sorting domain-containing protein [Verrucomicrobiota bacterium]